MSFQTLMQAAPAKANELFAKLSETSDGAVKTREKLFADLKAELELHTNLEEQHLFPVLRRNAETKRGWSPTRSRTIGNSGQSLLNSTPCRRTMRPSPGGSRSCKRPSASTPATKSANCCPQCSGH